MKTTIAVLVMAGALVAAGCAEDLDEAIDEAEPGLTTFEPPAGTDTTIADEAGTLPEGTTQECFDAVAAAGDETAVEGFADDSEPLWPAFDACTSVEEFSAATESVSGVLGEEQPEQYVRDLCSSVEEISGSTLCLEVGAG